MSVYNQLYKNFSKLFNRWPFDSSKGVERDLRHFLGTKYLKKVAFIDSAMVPRAKRQLKCLEEILENACMKKYPVNYKVGIFGETVEHAHYWASEKGREELMLKKRQRRWFS